MTTPRNKGRAPGMTVLGVPMSVELKAKIQKAADASDRKMADWARLALRDAAEFVIAQHQNQSRTTYDDLKVAEDPAPYKVAPKNGTGGSMK